jgi:hypothetical protein
MEEKDKKAKDVLGIAYYPLIAILYPLVWVHSLHRQSPLPMALLDILMAATIIVKW